MSVLARVGLGVLVVGVAGACALAVVAFQSGGVAAVVSPDAAIVEPGPGQEAPAADVAGPASRSRVNIPPVAGQPVHLSIPAVGLEANVGAMRIPASRAVDPPTPGSAYWLRDYSIVGPAATGTAYIAGHTYRGSGKAVFNALFDRGSHQTVVAAGDEVDVVAPEAAYRYVVTQVADYDKDAVADATSLWQDLPGRLVIVCCQYNGSAASTQNLVVYAQLETGSASG